jgi:hypothetical protein
MGLGPLHTISLAEARERVRECRRQRYDGIDPIEARQGKRRAAQLEAVRGMTFQGRAEKYVASHRAGWRSETHAKQWLMTLKTYIYPCRCSK